ncbi:MAG: sensor histidine kinase [Candidatus Brocadiales bacterium]
MAKNKIFGPGDSLIRYLSHELRSPLAKMEMSLRLHEKVFKANDNKDAQKRAEVYDTLISSIHRLKHNVQNTLDLFSLNYCHAKLKKDNVILGELVSCALKEVQGEAERKGIELVSSLPKDIPTVPGDSQKIYNALINLLGNALKFTDKGHVRVSVRTLPSQVEVSVSDTGIGLDTNNEYISRLFEPFTEDTGGFTRPGIGLFVCKSTIERHGGEIWVESKGRNKGATFRFTLPV